MPKAAPMSPLRKSPVDSAAISDRPKMASQKYSTGPKASAASASAGEHEQRQRADDAAHQR